MKLSQDQKQQIGLRRLCKKVLAHLTVADVELAKPYSNERDDKIATSCFDIERAVDVALRGSGIKRSLFKLRKIPRKAQLKTGTSKRSNVEKKRVVGKE